MAGGSATSGLCGAYIPPTLEVLIGRPWTSPDRSIQVAFDGRIYNRSDLGRQLGLPIDTLTDAAVVGHQYQLRGIDCVQKLQGVFAFALLDRTQPSLHLVRDRLGIKPLYYAVVGGSITFASRVASIFATSVVTPEINLHALPYFLFGVRNVPETIFSEILTLPPGHLLIADSNGHRVQGYWDVPFPQAYTESNRPAAEYIEEFDALLTETVKTYMQGSEVGTGLLLSGGLDSSVLACLATGGSSLRTYSIVFKSPEYKALDESNYSAYVARHIGSKHGEFDYQREHVNAHFLDTLQQFECPSYPGDIQHAIPFYLINKGMAQEGIRAVLSGAGADEILGGYPHQQIERIRRWGQRRSPAWANRLYSTVSRWHGDDPGFIQRSHDEILKVYGHNLASLMFWIKDFSFIRDNLTKFFSDEVVAALGADRLTGALHMKVDSDDYRRLHPFDQSLYLDIKTRLVDFVLLTAHQMSQAFDIEARFPYLDHHMVEYVAALPLRLKMRGITLKYILQEVGRKHLPLEFFRRDKRGFGAPFAREVFLDRKSFLLNELLSPSALRRVGYVRPSFVQALLERYPQEQHYATRAAIHFLLERALLIQGIHRVFIETPRWRAKVAALLMRAVQKLEGSSEHRN